MWTKAQTRFWQSTRAALCTCLACDAKLNFENPWLCQACLAILPRWKSVLCFQCASHLTDSGSKTICGACLKKPPHYDRVFALFPYEFPIADFIHVFKHGGQLLWANFFADTFLQRMPSWYEGEDLPNVIIPVPLHVKRLAERGFNQSVEIAKILARTLNMPCELTGVKKTIPTNAQRQLNQAGRARNVKNVFSVSKPLDHVHCIILDDVLASGHTANSLARALKKAGAARVDIWCCARASLQLK